ncbi:MAG TPA: hypothetical protein VLB44_22940 [Kofleriaceae bacterium]|nr:hypothetical protein [Kofleriaceae bacterium]
MPATFSPVSSSTPLPSITGNGKVGVSSQSITAVHTPISTPAPAPVKQSTWGSASQSAAKAQPTWGSSSQPAPQGSSWGSAAVAQAVAQHAPQAKSWGSAAVAQAAIAQPVMSQPLPTPPSRMPHASSPPPMTQPPMGTPAQGILPAPLPTAQAVKPAGKVSPDAPTVTAPPIIESSPARPAAGPVATPSRWSAFENLGLRAPKIDHKKVSTHVVTAYRLLGFVILTVIVLALVSYLVTTAFFYMSDSWVVPMSISPTDEKVVSLQSQLAERQTNRDRTAAELDQAERAIVVQQEFQAEFAKAIKSDLQGRKAALARMYELANQAASTRAQIKRSNSAYASAAQKRMAAEWKAGLIDRDAMLNGKFQQAQISGSNLNLAERQAEYETRAADLEAQTHSLEALLDDASQDQTMSYDVLRIKQEFEASRLETQRAIENRDMLKSALIREDKLLASLKQSSYMKAMTDGAQVAFVPYSNLSNVKKGEPLYGCAMTMVFCKKVGTVLEILPGEVQFKHPNRDKQLRGQMVELKLDHADSATDDVLFVGGRPLLI